MDAAENMVTLMKYSAVIFNLDGTLLDTLGDLTAAVNHALKGANYPEKTEEEVRKAIGNSMGETIRHSVPRGTTWEESWELIEPCDKYFAENCTEQTKAYKGVLKLLDALKKEGIKVAVIANRTDEQAKAICKKFFGRRVALTVGEKEGVKKSPAPDMLIEIMKEFDVSMNEVAYVGNIATDVQLAKNAGVKGFAVSWGFKDRNSIENHGGRGTTIVDTPEELLALLVKAPASADNHSNDIVGLDGKIAQV